MLLLNSLYIKCFCFLIIVNENSANNFPTDDWNNWIVFPTVTRTNKSVLKSFHDFNGNQSKFFDQMEPYIVSTLKTNEKKNHYYKLTKDFKHEDETDKRNDVLIPLGRAVEKVQNVWNFLKAIYDEYTSHDMEMESNGREANSGRKAKKYRKKFKKFILPLLLAYKLKFLTLIPVLIGGLTLLVGTTGLAGFFFALFAAVMSLKTDSSTLEIKKW